MKLSQTQQILDYLKTGHSITALESLYAFKCLRLASRINEIRHMGYNVVSELVKDGAKHYSKYHLYAK